MKSTEHPFKKANKVQQQQKREERKRREKKENIYLRERISKKAEENIQRASGYMCVRGGGKKKKEKE